MKRRDLEKRLRHAGGYLKREGGSNSLWLNPRTGVADAVPRHAEIKESLAWKRSSDRLGLADKAPPAACTGLLDSVQIAFRASFARSQ